MNGHLLPGARHRGRVAAGVAAGVLALAAAVYCTRALLAVDGVERPSGGPAPWHLDQLNGVLDIDVDAGVPTERGEPAVSWSAAIAAAESTVEGGNVTMVRLEDRGGTRVWRVDVITPEPRVHNVSVEAATGALVGSRADGTPQQARQYLRIPLAKLAGSSVGLDEVTEAALAETGGGFISELSLQGSVDQPLWSVRVTDRGSRHLVDVDAGTGSVVLTALDSPHATGQSGFGGPSDCGFPGHVRCARASVTSA